MPDLSEFDKTQIVGARIAGRLVTKTAKQLSFSRATMQGP